MTETITCTRCGHVKACLHYPDAICVAAFWNEINYVRRSRAKTPTEDGPAGSTEVRGGASEAKTHRKRRAPKSARRSRGAGR